MNQRIIYLIVSCLFMDTYYVWTCPLLPENGEMWIEDNKGGPRCILRCNKGYVPSGCHILRRKGDEWNYVIPECVEDSYTAKTVLKYAAIGSVATVGAPYVVGPAGFRAGGMVGGPLPAAGMAGSWFAAVQRARAAVKAAIEGTAKFVEETVRLLYCEQE